MSVPRFLTDGTFASGLSYALYEDLLREQTRKDPAQAASDQERKHLGSAAVNLQRATRLWRTCAPGPDVCGALARITSPQRWLVLSEVWCGDSAQNIPVIARIAERTPLVTLRLLLRDSHLEIMDLYLSDGKRSIPKLVAFDTDGRELFRWGPRPAPAMRLVAQALTEGVPKEVREERLHLWYAKDRGKTVEMELLNLVESALVAS